MDDGISKRINKAIEEEVFPGCVFGYITKDGVRNIKAFGNFTYKKDSKLVEEGTVYDVASVTKAIPTSLCLMHMIDSKKLSLDDRVVDFIPEFNNSPGKDQVTIHHLLTYTLDLVVPAMSSLKDEAADYIVKKIVEAPLKVPPGQNYLYTNSTTLFMGLIIKEVSGLSLDEYARDNLFEPLNMNNSTFHPENFDKEEFPPTEIDEWRGDVQGVVHDESVYKMGEKYVTGISGLFSNANDLLNVLEAIIHEGFFDGKRVFSKNMVNKMSENQLMDGEKQTGLGWQLNDTKWNYMGDNHSERTIGQNGFTGCHVMCDVEKGLGLTLLSNRTYPKRGDGAAINQVRRDLANILLKRF